MPAAMGGTPIPAVSRADVVINEIFHNAPNDPDDLRRVECYNDGENPLDLAGGTSIAAQGVSSSAVDHPLSMKGAEK